MHGLDEIIRRNDEAVEAARERYDDVGAIIAYEQGELDESETVTLFQHLIDTGQAWTLQGSYGRTATALIEAGHCDIHK